MDFKFIILALVISTSKGNETNTQKEAPESLKSYPLSTTTTPSTITITNTTTTTTETPAPTTIPPTTPPTTPKTTVTTPAPTTTPTPPTAAPEDGTWTVKNGSDVCIMAKMELQFNLTFTNHDNKIQSIIILVPKNATANGTCANETHNIVLNWDEGNTFTISFEANKTSGLYDIKEFVLTVNLTKYKQFVDVGSNMTYKKDKPAFLSVPLKMSYKCDKKQAVVMTSVDNMHNATLIIAHAQLEAFMPKPSSGFSEAKDCEGFDTPDIVPIAVGCVLSFLVIIVLVAYMIGRRRSQSRGYLSM